MILLLVASGLLALGIVLYACAARRNPRDRAAGYPQGSYERRTLEGLRP